MKPWRTIRPIALAAALLTAACQTSLASQAAVLQSGDAETMAKVKTVLAVAMGRTDIEFGAGDPTETPAISVLPRRPSSYEDRSPATPTLFDLTLSKGVCYATRRDTGEAFALEGVACRPLEK
ncbi:MAG: hypothetical protein KAH44_30885 [Oricola sp.]|jgi:hypothetical protein|nr:hypothetical protein [Oricola sp.]